MLVAASAIDHCAAMIVDTKRFGRDLVQHLISIPNIAAGESGEMEITAGPADSDAQFLLQSAYVALYDHGDTSKARVRVNECLQSNATSARVECLLVLLDILDQGDGLANRQLATDVLEAVAGFFETSEGEGPHIGPSKWRRIFSKYFLALHSLRNLHGVWTGDVHLDVFEAIRNKTGWIHPWQTPDGHQFVSDPAIELPSKTARPFWPATEFPDTRRQLEENVFPAIRYGIGIEFCCEASLCLVLPD